MMGWLILYLMWGVFVVLPVYALYVAYALACAHADEKEGRRGRGV